MSKGKGPLEGLFSIFGVLDYTSAVASGRRTEYSMNEFLKMDSFFFVSTIGFVVLGILLVVVLIYVIMLLRSLNKIAHTVEEETDAIKVDLDEARESIRREGANLFTTIGSLLGFVHKSSKRLRTKKRRNS